MEKLVIYTDGGSRGNPGPAAIGAVITNQRGDTIKKYSQAIGQATNNEAEYQAAIFALKKIKALFGKKKAKGMSVEVRMDSELVASQLNHQYKIQEESLQSLFLKVWNLMLDFKKVKFVAISRTENRGADHLVNQALDKEDKNLTLF